MNMPRISILFCLLASVVLGGCATESHKSLHVDKVNSHKTAYHGKRVSLAVGKFNNKSSYMNGIFSDGQDRLGSQAKSVLITHLQQTKRFNVMDRENLQEISEEVAFLGKNKKIKGAEYIVTGSVAEFGRKQVGDKQFFGIFGRGKSQIAYAKINLNIVDTETSEVVYTVQGAGEYELSNREVLGFGGTASYDSTLNGKVLDLAMREAINSMVSDIESDSWKLKA